MVKAILGIDMPLTCEECILYDYKWCNGSRKHMRLPKGQLKPKWCPLKEMPSKMIPEMVIGNRYSEGIVKGWNDCIEELEK